MKIIFAGTPVFAQTALARIKEAGHEIVLVLTQPDRPKGRGLAYQPSPVKAFATAHHIPVYQPHSLRLNGAYSEEALAIHTLLKETPFDMMVVAAYGLILPQSILDIPHYGCFNIHASLLPRWRGAAPIHHAILSGDTKTGITIIQMTAALDAGPMLLKKEIPILPFDTQTTLHDKLADLGSVAILEAIDQCARDALTPTIQPEKGLTYAPKITKAEALLNFNAPAYLIERKVRALNPHPGTYAYLQGIPIKIGAVEQMDENNHPIAGQIIYPDKHTLGVTCQTGTLRLTLLQKPGGKMLPTHTFLSGFPLHDGMYFDTFPNTLTVSS